MRALFFALVLANVGFLAWARYFDVPPAKPASATPRETAPEKLRIVPKPARRATPVSQLDATQSAPCLEWGAFTRAAYQRAQKALEPLALAGRLSPRRVEEPTGWWVFVSPEADREAALRKAAELKRLGVDDYYVISDEGPWRWAVSLGLFRTEEAALGRLAALRAQGVDGAQAAVRATRSWLQIRGASALFEARLRELAREIEGSEVRGCA